MFNTLLNTNFNRSIIFTPMRMILFFLFICGLTFKMNGQENQRVYFTINQTQWEKLNMPLKVAYEELKSQKYKLQEVNLYSDIRGNAFKKKYSMYVDQPSYKDISTIFTIAPKKTKQESSFKFGNSTNTFLTTPNGVKNSVYRDESLYNRFYCPATGRSLYY